jgi:hypothetical protein
MIQFCVNFFFILFIKLELPTKCILICSYQLPISTTLRKHYNIQAVALCDLSKLLDKFRSSGWGSKNVCRWVHASYFVFNTEHASNTDYAIEIARNGSQRTPWRESTQVWSVLAFEVWRSCSPSSPKPSLLRKKNPNVSPNEVHNNVCVAAHHRWRWLTMHFIRSVPVCSDLWSTTERLE